MKSSGTKETHNQTHKDRRMKKEDRELWEEKMTKTSQSLQKNSSHLVVIHKEEITAKAC